MTKRRLLLSMMLAAGLGAAAQQTMTLEQCIDYALAHNLTVKQQDVSLRRSSQELESSRNQRLPQVGAQAGYTYSMGRSITENNTYANSNTQNVSMSLNASVPLFTGLRITNQIAQSRLNLAAATADLAKAREDVALQVTQYYLQVLCQQELAAVARRQVALSEQQLTRLQGQLKAGKSAAPEVAEMEAQLAQDRHSAVQAEGNVSLALLDLSQMLELGSPDSLRVADPTLGEPPVLEGSARSIYEQAVMARPQVEAERLRLKGSEYAVKVARAGYYPSVSLGAGLGTGYYKSSGIRSDAFGRQLNNNFSRNISLTLSIPIFDAFQTRNAIRTARLNQENQALQLAQVEKTLYKEIQQAWQSAVNAQSSYASSKVSEEAAREAFRLMSKKFESGKATPTEFADSKTKLEKAESDRVQALYECMFRVRILDFYRSLHALKP